MLHGDVTFNYCVGEAERNFNGIAFLIIHTVGGGYGEVWLENNYFVIIFNFINKLINNIIKYSFIYIVEINLSLISNFRFAPVIS